MMSSSHFSETIERLIGQFLAENSSDPLGLREIVSRLSALPVIRDIGGCYSIRPNGEIISFMWDTPDDIRVEEDHRIQNMALFQGRKKYPALLEFVPVRSVTALDCPHCQGKGQLPEPMATITCYCGGTGWLPPNTPLTRPT